ncbi:hypothetical protein AAFC00_003104 [Neodothiora populina]|uniref:Calcium channel YVC1-like C-terminal transmembrane domain-containing protein n=1 Tax=Neodothiora populina TaxID=2781224 RepID=A0ABR3P9E5_9PEZI
MALPVIEGIESFDELIAELAQAFNKTVTKPCTFEELRHGPLLTPLVKYLHTDVHHVALVHAIMALRGHFISLETDDVQDVNITRAYACEATALRFVNMLSGREKIDMLLYELPCPGDVPQEVVASNDSESNLPRTPTERSPLVTRQSGTSTIGAVSSTGSEENLPASSSDHAEHFEGLNALEIAAVSGAKSFLSQKPIQRIIDAIWKGDIVFWSILSSHATKRAQVYQRKTIDPFSRLRVPVYLKAFEVLFFVAFLAFYYAVLVQREFHYVTVSEIFLYIWIASFAYNEIGEYWDAGSAFYMSDFWSAWDIFIVLIGVAFFIARMIGLAKGNDRILDTAFDILSMEALFLVPRICSLLSIHPYFGTLIPCLSAMTIEFTKFLSIVVVLYTGFLTTFCLLARGSFTFRQMTLILTKVFFGSSYLGFDIAEKISPYLGLPLMLIFIVLTNILLITSLISILSNSLTKVIDHARDEYLFVYSVFVLEASTSNRLTYFLPPLNLIPLALRPLRLFLSAEQLRSTRILLLKATHVPHVLAISLYEKLRRSVDHNRDTGLGLSAPRPRTSELPSSWRRSVLNNRLSGPYPLVAAIRSQGSSSSKTQSPRKPRKNDKPTKESQEDLKAILGQLKAQVDHLAKMIEQQSEYDRDN